MKSSDVTELTFLETSALTGENVEETFLQCARNILVKIESGMRKNFCDDFKYSLSARIIAG